MDIPLDFRTLSRPVREKYLIDETPLLSHWFEFGTHPDGTVDVSSPSGDVMVAVPPADAKALIAARAVFCAEILRIVNGA